MPARWIGLILMGAIMSAFSCSRPTHAAADLPKPAVDLPAPKEGETTRTAVLAGGCFWCIETSLKHLDGVSEVVSGYAGGKAEDAKYELVGSGQTGHAEAVKVTYDPTKISFGELLRVLFTIIDPTTVNGQHPDYGPQYRSAVFYANDDEKKVAESYIKQVNDAKIFDKPIATTVEPLTGFYKAEAYHQNYAELNPNQPYIRQFSMPKVEKVKKNFGDRLKPASTQPSK